MKQPVFDHTLMHLSLPVVLITFLFAGCASYQAKPLTHRVDLAPTVDQLTSPMVRERQVDHEHL